MDIEGTACTWYVYVLFEAHETQRPYTKIGFSTDPLKRLRELQDGNPRVLRTLDYSRRPHGEFGYPCPNETIARQIELAVHAELETRGCRVPHDVIGTLNDQGLPEYGSRSITTSEWFEIDPEEADKVVMQHWAKLGVT